MEVLINSRSIYSFIDFIFSYVYKTQELVWLVAYIILLWFSLKYVNCMGACEDERCIAVIQIQIWNCNKWISKVNLLDHWKPIIGTGQRSHRLTQFMLIGWPMFQNSLSAVTVFGLPDAWRLGQ
jgi:hypothetical protein